MSRLFDTYIAVDWSSRNEPSKREPSKDAIWVGESSWLASSTVQVTATYSRTRSECREYLQQRLAQLIEQDRRIFVGFDFAFGYPKGFAKAIDLVSKEPPWQRVWRALSERIEDDPRNRNNRFDVASDLNSVCGMHRFGPFWGHHPSHAFPSLQDKKPHEGYPYLVDRGPPLDEFRLVEKTIGGTIKSPWQLFGSGSVGGQSLVGIPTLCRLRDQLLHSSAVTVWPFETGFTSNPSSSMKPVVVIGEIWPNVFPLTRDADIPDKGQVLAVVDWLTALDDAEVLGEMFDRPDGISDAEVHSVLSEEGWIIGAGFDHRNHRGLGQDLNLHLVGGR